MNKYLPLILLLSSCVSYSGNSVASRTVTSDIMKYIKLFELSQNCNKIQAVHREPYSSHPEKQEYEELWTVTACGQKNKYYVSMKPDGMGGTLFNIGSSGQ